jgi:hypothetical protein
MMGSVDARQLFFYIVFGFLPFYVHFHTLPLFSLLTSSTLPHGAQPMWMPFVSSRLLLNWLSLVSQL